MPDFPDLLTAALQVLILSAGVYLLLGFLRTTRGSGLVRGLGVTLLVGGVGLWGFAELLGLNELLHVLRTILQVAVIVLAILFHPELRRGIVSLGDNKLLGRFLQSHKREVISEIAASMVAMAKKKQGALVAIERKTPLDAYIEGGVKVDAEVNRLLLDSIFHHGSALHDGAVIVRGDRIEAAASLFPLTENLEISKSTGTRHRAALGLTEETDAVTVAVSEENGLISVCKGGKMERRVGRDALEDVLRERVGTDEAAGAAQPGVQPESGLKTFLNAVFVANPFEKLVALGLGFLLFVSAYNAVRTDREFDLDLRAIEVSEDAGPQAGRLVVITPENLRVDIERQSVRVRVRAPRDVMTSLAGGLLGGTLRVQENEKGERELTVDDVTWSAGPRVIEDAALTEVEWIGPAPRIALTGYGSKEFTLERDWIDIDDAALGTRREIDEDGLRFVPAKIKVRGPESKLSGTSELRFEPVELQSEIPDEGWTTTLALAPELTQQGFELEGDPGLVVPVRPRPEELATIDVEVTLISLDAAQPDLVDRFEQPKGRIRLKVVAVGIPTENNMGIALTDLAQEHARIWVDVSRVDLSQGDVLVEAPFRIVGVERDVWLAQFADSSLYEELRDDAHAELRMAAVDGVTTVALTVIEKTDEGGANGADDADGGGP